MTLTPDPHICAQCAALGRTCCTLLPGNEELCFPISAAEQQMILDWGGSPELFAELPNSPAFRNSLDFLFPEDRLCLRELFPKGGRHKRLGTTCTGECLLLGPQGCRLPRENRPWYCRIFPFWVRFGEVMVIPSSSCLGVRQAPEKDACLALYGLDDGAVLEIFRRLRQTWGLEGLPWLPAGR